jgi:hypothetical protein
MLSYEPLDAPTSEELPDDDGGAEELAAPPCDGEEAKPPPEVTEGLELAELLEPLRS